MLTVKEATQIGINACAVCIRVPPSILALDSESKFPYHTSCNASLTDGTTTFLDYA